MRSVLSPPTVASESTAPRIALALSGGGARGLTHIGVLDVLERAGLRPDWLAGSSMGGLVAALFAAGLSSREVFEVAREFHLPRRFVPGGVLRWRSVFRSALAVLPRTFRDLVTPLAVSAVDLETGNEIVLHDGLLREALEATCAVPGVMAPVRLEGRWLIDGGTVNPLPVDLAWMGDPDVVVAVKAGGVRARSLPALHRLSSSVLSFFGELVPNPATARLSWEVLVRAAEIGLDRQVTLAAAMTGPEVLVEPDMGDVSIKDFERIDEAVAAGRSAAERVLPDIRAALAAPPHRRATGRGDVSLHIDPVCAMVVNRARARASLRYAGVRYFFCSINCRDCFARNPGRYLRARAPRLGRATKP